MAKTPRLASQSFLGAKGAYVSADLSPGTPARADLQSRTVRRLQMGVIPGGLGMTAAFSAAALLGREITDSNTLGALAGVSLSIGATLAGIPLAALMARTGRRIGIRTGYLIGAGGAALACVAALVASFPLLIAGMILVGTAQASNLASRYAGADLATEDNRARSISLVLWASTIGSVLGPTLALGMKGLFGGADDATSTSTSGYAIPYVLAIVLLLTAAGVISTFLRPDPLHVASAGTTTKLTLPSWRDVRRILSHPIARVALFGITISQAVMVGLMTVAPLHMDDGSQSAFNVGVMMSTHIAGMFAFSPIMGRLVDRFGGEVMVMLGAIVLAVGAANSAVTNDHDPLGHISGLFWIGIGWSACVVAGSALLTASFPVEQRVSVQATADVLMTALGASAGVLAGIAYDAWGFNNLAWIGLAISIALGAFTVGARGMHLLASRSQRQAVPASG